MSGKKIRNTKQPNRAGSLTSEPAIVPSEMEGLQVELARAQLAKTKTEWEQLKRPWYRNGLEILKVAGAIAALVVALAGGALQIWTGALTAQNASLQAQTDRAQIRLNSVSLFASPLKEVPDELIGDLRDPTLKITVVGWNKGDSEAWKKEKISDALLVRAALDVGCNDFGSAQQDLDGAKDNDVDHATNIDDYKKEVTDLQIQYDDAVANGQNFDACSSP
ncbi:hypothetical protein [Mesorhizobium sp. CN2-181]|uniref:hypothetical protein n=1 Tax=Mesorhizobium yinganensis TaxID=3157707 RepID=UPI0032B882D8